jgi:hypothetical protein
MSDALGYFIAVNTKEPTEYVVKVNGSIDLRNAPVLQEAQMIAVRGPAN